MKTLQGWGFLLCALAFAPVCYSMAGSQFEVWSVDGKKREGQIIDWDKDSLRIKGVVVKIAPNPNEKPEPLPLAQPFTLPLNQLVKVVHKENPVTALMPQQDIIALPQGDRFSATIVGGEEFLETAGGLLSGPTESETKSGQLKITTTSLLGLVYSNKPEEREKKLLQFQKEKRNMEVVFLNNGDIQRGTFLKLSPAITIQTDQRISDFQRASVLAFGFDSEMAKKDYPPFESTYFDVVLKDGSRVGLTEVRLRERRLSGVLRAKTKTEVSLSLDNVARIYHRSPQVVYLSDKEPAATKHQAGLREWKAVAFNETLRGDFLKTGGEFYDWGISVRPQTLMAYRLKGNPKRFQVRIGQDDRGPDASAEAQGAADAEVSIFVDKQKKFEFKHLNHHTKPLDVDVDVSEGKVLILRTEFGDRKDLGDNVDWIEPRLLYETAP